MENQVADGDASSAHDSHPLNTLNELHAGDMTGTTPADFDYQFAPYDDFDHDVNNALAAAFDPASATPPISAPHSITDATANLDGFMPPTDHVKNETHGPTPAEDTPTTDMPADANANANANTTAPDYETKNETAVSDDDSQDDANDRPGTSLLDDPLPFDFGLAASDPVAAIEIRGAGGSAGHRPSVHGKDDKAGTDATPAWSELKTKAGKERKRLPLACIACRRKKIRCSGEKPACKHCIKSRTPCVYKATTRKATPRTDYMAMLDRRIKRMEDRIIKIVPKSEEANAATTTVSRAVVKAAIPGTGGTDGASASGSASGSKAAAARKRAAEDAFGPELDNWARGSKNRPGSVAPPLNMLIKQETEDNKLFQEGEDALPSKEMQVHLSTVFFENIYGQAYHLLHRPSYMRKLRAGTLPPVLILSVCAVSARFSNDPSFGNTLNFLRGEEWASEARDIVTRRYEWPNITILTCLLILGLHEFGTCHGGRSWALGGQAIRMAFALQLHKDLDRESPQGPPLSFIDREIRRRTMWACFLMDRFNSSGTDRPTFIKEETIKIQLPIKESLFQLDTAGSTENLSGDVADDADAKAADSSADATDAIAAASNPPSPASASENMGVAAYMVRAIAVWGRVINYLNQGGKELDPYPMWHPESGYAILSKQVDELLSKLPSTLAFTPDNWNTHRNEGTANQFLFLHIAIQQNILFMNRFAVSSPKENTPQGSAIPTGFVTKAGAKAFAAANRISFLLKDSDSMILSAPFVGYCAFLSSTVHIFGIFSGNPAMADTAKQNLGITVRFLAKMKRYWGMFHFMSENLRDQYRSCADAAQQGTPGSDSASASSPIFQYGDWFDRYPHGVADDEFGEQVAPKKKEKGDDAVLEQKAELKTVGEFFVGGDADTAKSGSTAGTARDGAPRAIANARRKSVAKKPQTASASAASSRAAEPMPMDPLVTDLTGSNAVALHAQQQIQLQQQQQQQQQQQRAPLQSQPQLGQHDQHRRHFSISGESNGPHNFNGMSLAHSQVTASAVAAASFEASMTPISPAGIVPFNMHHHQHPQQQHQHPQQQHQHPQHPQHQQLPQHPHHAHPHHHAHQHQQPAQFFQQDMMSLSQQGAMLPELDRQLVFGAYGGSIDGASTSGGVSGVTGVGGVSGVNADHASLDTAMSWDAPSQNHRASVSVSVSGVSVSAAMDHRAGVAAAAEAMHAYAQGQSSAWFMPFNMDPPEITQDLSSMNGLDQFANIFGNNNGIGPGQGGGGLGNLH